jgi:hypothetical protein
LKRGNDHSARDTDAQRESLLIPREPTKSEPAEEDAPADLSLLAGGASQLSAAPLCLAVLGQLNLIATGPDFSLR